MTKKQKNEKKKNEKNEKNKKIENETIPKNVEPITNPDIKQAMNQDSTEQKNLPKEKEKGADEKKFKCIGCKDASFETSQEFRNHYKTEWHNFNLKRKMQKKSPVDEEEAKNLLFDQDFNKNLKR